MFTMNKVILIGRITKDPELRKTPTDVSVVQFTLAVDRNYQGQNGERQADFINCVAWRGQAENLARYIRKGSRLAVEGSIQTRQYDDQSGIRRYVTEVICSNVTFIESKRNDNDFGDLSQLPQEPVQRSYQNSNYQNNNYQNNNYQNNNYNGYQNNNYNNYNQANNFDNQKQEEKNPFDFDNDLDVDEELPF